MLLKETQITKSPPPMVGKFTVAVSHYRTVWRLLLFIWRLRRGFCVTSCVQTWCHYRHPILVDNGYHRYRIHSYSNLFIRFSWKYQHRENQVAYFYPHNNKLELIWTIIPAIVLAALVFTGWKAWVDITRESPEVLRLEIMGYQYAWSGGIWGQIIKEITTT